MIDPVEYLRRREKVFPAFFALGVYTMLERDGYQVTPGVKLYFVTLCQSAVKDIDAVDTLVVRKMCEDTARELTRHWHGIPSIDTTLVAFEFIEALAREGRWCNPNDPLAVACRSELARLRAQPHVGVTVTRLYGLMRMRLKLLKMYLSAE